ncbi:PREDICTED: protein RMD5 homolog A-like [Tarenaya hassleriana]|uniref:protein RMD5 homolog A-like n=1 Tax=Tarenaya hassleriana TaxID=28532 RepID=UPI00053C2ED4|nr:PREDICTED: protein RMD5 homolog A-like [Tarenaya hassleriana]
MRMELTSIKDAFDRVSKKQKLSYSKTQEAVDKLSQEIEKALRILQEAPPDAPLEHKSIVAELKKKLQEIAPISQLEASQKELNVALSKFPKILEKTLNPDISKACRNVEFDTHIVNQIIASFFYRQGMFEIGDCFIAETGEAECSARQSFMEMYQILEAMKKRDLGPALNWAALNSEKLKQARSDLEMKLHSLHFLEIAQDKNSNEALNYARKHIATFADSCLPEIQKLMCSLLWNRKLDKSPYSEFLSPALWYNAVKELTRQYCNLIGESYESPLSVTVAAGTQALPPLLKYKSLMVNKKQDWQTMEQLPIPVELSEEFQFHSVFVCPVSKEQSTEDNPPMMMTCGHVLCKQSINKMSKNGSRSFKCPYCPSDIDATQCRQLHF